MKSLPLVTLFSLLLWTCSGSAQEGVGTPTPSTPLPPAATPEPPPEQIPLPPAPETSSPPKTAPLPAAPAYTLTLAPFFASRGFVTRTSSEDGQLSWDEESQRSRLMPLRLRLGWSHALWGRWEALLDSDTQEPARLEGSWPAQGPWAWAAGVSYQLFSQSKLLLQKDGDQVRQVSTQRHWSVTTGPQCDLHLEGWDLMASLFVGWSHFADTLHREHKNSGLQEDTGERGQGPTAGLTAGVWAPVRGPLQWGARLRLEWARQEATTDGKSVKLQAWQGELTPLELRLLW